MPSNAEQQLKQWWAQRLPLWRADPLLWIREVLGGPAPWSRQEEILQAVATNREVNVASGKSVGKDWLAARIVLWWLYTHPESIVVTTGPTERHVHTVLWGEIRKAYHRSKIPLGGELLPVESKLRLGEKWWAEGIVAKDEGALQGYHAPYVMVVMDEAAELKEWVFETLEGCATGPDDRIVRLGNPKCGPSHPFAKAFSSPSPRAKNIRIRSTETPNYVEGRVVIPGLASRDWVAEEERKRSRDMFRAVVMGEFPAGSSDSLITGEHIAQARERWKVEPPVRTKDDPPLVVRLGVDVARFGDDLTVFALLEGNRARIVGTLSKADGVMVARKASELARQYAASSVAIDGGGLGSGAVDSLVELQRRGEVPANVQIYDVEFGAGATDKTEHANKRTELWHRLRDWLWTEGALDPDAETEEELLATTYKWGRGSAAMLEPKERIKARLGRSPDRADALALAVAGHVGKVRQRGALTVHWV